jgi:uncharacterized phiE125 gp8 family phage protein
MNVNRTTEPTTEPLDLAAAKEHLRVIDFEEDDAYITSLISAARRTVEDMTGRTLIDTTFTQSARGWSGFFDLLRGNGRSIGSVKYDDADGVEQTVDPTLYGIHPYGDGCAALALYNEFTAPDLIDRPFVDRIRIQFTAGYGAAATDVPQPLRQAVLYLVAHYYDNRSPVGVNVNLNKMPFTVEALSAPYKIYN